jgi:hypothetical protein
LHPADAALLSQPIVSPASKFTQSRKERILQVLRAGGTRLDATRAAEIDPVTFRRWLEHGRTSKVPDGRWARFREQVLEAEGAPPELQVLRDRFELAMTTGETAWAFLEQLERDEQADVPEGPVQATVTFAPTTAKGDQ